jgi:hypothetical protein
MVKWSGVNLWAHPFGKENPLPTATGTVHISTQFTKKEKRSKKERNNYGGGPPNPFVQPYGCSPEPTSLLAKGQEIW